jgi:hypothetical protein
MPTWILQDNLLLFLERVSALIGYRFEDWDWDAIRFGMRDIGVEQAHGYEYELSGAPPVKLAFAEAGDAKRLRVHVETEDHTAARIDALARILQCYAQTTGTQDLETLIEAAFMETPAPDQSKIVACDAAHFARCPECQEALSFFRGRHWIDLLRGKASLPRSYAGLELLTPEARRFFFPAYLVKAIRDKDEDLLEMALESTRPDMWTPLQQELIEFTSYLLHRTVG